MVCRLSLVRRNARRISILTPAHRLVPRPLANPPPETLPMVPRTKPRWLGEARMPIVTVHVCRRREVCFQLVLVVQLAPPVAS